MDLEAMAQEQQPSLFYFCTWLHSQTQVSTLTVSSAKNTWSCLVMTPLSHFACLPPKHACEESIFNQFPGQEGAAWKFAKVRESHSVLSRYTFEFQTETSVALGTERPKVQWLNKRQCQWISWQASVSKCGQMLCQENWFGNKPIVPKAWQPPPVLLLNIS